MNPYRSRIQLYFVPPVESPSRLQRLWWRGWHFAPPLLGACLGSLAGPITAGIVFVILLGVLWDFRNNYYDRGFLPVSPSNRSYWWKRLKL